MIDPTLPLLVEEPLVIEFEKQEKNKRLPTTGFHTNPERINRNGRPKKGYSVTEHVKELLANQPEDMNEIVNKIISAAKAGDIAAIKVLWNYMDGMPMQANDITSAGEKITMPHISIDTKPRGIDQVS